MKSRKIIWLVVLIAGLSSCNLVKFVPEDKYLLNKVTVKVDEQKQVSASSMRNYLRQTENTRFLGFWPLQLCIYNTAPKDTTKKSNRWLAKNAHKMGEAPEIYDEQLTSASITQLERAMQNKGYFNAVVDTAKKINKKKRKINLTYTIHGGMPYTIKSYKVDLNQSDLRRAATGSECLLHAGDRFETETMERERERITAEMRKDGYYYFEKSLLEYEADSSYRTHEATLVMRQKNYLSTLPDSIVQQIFTRMSIRRVSFYVDYDPDRLPEGVVPHSEKFDGYEYSYVGTRLLRNSVLRKNSMIRPGEIYSEENVEKTYAQLNRLGPVKYVDISFDQVGPDELDCQIVLTRNKLNSVSAEIEGTYSAGDWGVALGLGYVNKNIFRGAEQLSVNAHGSYEWRQNGGRAIEANGEVGIQWPNSLKVNFAYKYQRRPEEYTRTIANAGLYYTVQKHSRWKHRFNLIDLSYVRLPWISDQFKKDVLDRSSILRYSYENHFILDWSYMGSYSNQRSTTSKRSYVDFRYSLETAGNLLYGISKVAGLPTNKDGSYEIFGVPYSQYAKADVQLTYHQMIGEAHQLVYHAGVGVAVPYLNGASVPFEKRYFSGGSNSVRGWQARTLGPGGYRGTDGNLRYDLQAGDIKLDLNLEYRWQVWSFIELAAFTDAGNIWTIRDYETQPNGKFEWNKFYKQIAWAYGVGVRLNFSVLIFRVDFGVKLYDPTRLYSDGKIWRTVPNGLGWNDDMTFHFAIGHPF